MKRLLLLVMLLFLTGALLNVTDIYAATENSQTPDINQNLSDVQEDLTGTLNNETIQSSAGNAVKTVNLANDTSASNLQPSENTSNNSSYNELNNFSSDVTNVQNSTDAAGDDIYKNVRGIWLKAEDVDILNVDEIKAAGITDIFIKTNLIIVPTYQNVLTVLLNKLNGTNLRVHAWITCFKDSDDHWIDPANETQHAFLLDKISSITGNYAIDGIHLDYVRYSGVGNNAAYKHLNATNIITSFVKDVYNVVKSINSKIAVSAALMPECSMNPYYYGQDYHKLAPYLDFLVPMIYKGNYRNNTAWIGTTTKWIVENSGGKPVIAGIQTYRSDDDVTKIPASELIEDIKSAIDKGASGYVLFRYGLIDGNFFKNSGISNVFDFDQIVNAAIRVKNYIDTNKKLPDYVTINNVNVNMASFLELITTATLNIKNNDLNSVLYLYNCVKGPVPQDSVHSGNMPQSEYLKIASIVKISMDKGGVAPEFFENTSLGRFLGYENMIYMFSSILSYYNTSKTLPSTITVKPWKQVTQPSFTLDQVLTAANKVKDYVETYKKLPDYVTINNVNVNMASFLELITTTTLNIKNNDLNSVLYLYNCVKGPVPQDSIQSGNMLQSEYLKIASIVKISMDKGGVAPEFYENISLGRFLGYENMIYMYSSILSSYNTTKTLPSSIGVKPWKLITSTSFALNDVLTAAASVKNYVETYNKLPDYVVINGVNVSMPSFLELITTAVLNIKNNDLNSALYFYNCIKGHIPRDELQSGNIPQSEYLKIASIVKISMDKGGVAPEFFENTSLGRFLGYENMIYMFSNILASYKTNKVLTSTIAVKPWLLISNPNIVAFDNHQIEEAATRVKNYIESNQVLPSYVLIGTSKVNMAQFLELLVTSLIQINNGMNGQILLKSFSAPSNPAGIYSSGTINKSDYINMAQRIKSFMEINGIAPNYATNTLGNIQFETLVYLYSKILNFEIVNNYLPNYVTVGQWNKNSEIIPNDLQKYLQETANCQVNDYRIKALASSLVNGVSSTYDKGVTIFNWVRDNLIYSFYYNTRYGAVNTYLYREGNCVDHSHLLIALSRAAGIPAKYVHGTCTFTSGNVYGHVWAQLYINGKWHDADAISSRNSFGIINNWDKATAIINGNYAELPF